MSQYEWMCSSKESCTSSNIETSKKRIFFKKLGVVLFLLVNKKRQLVPQIKISSSPTYDKNDRARDRKEETPNFNGKDYIIILFIKLLLIIY